MTVVCSMKAALHSLQNVPRYLLHEQEPPALRSASHGQHSLLRAKPSASAHVSGAHRQCEHNMRWMGSKNSSASSCIRVERQAPERSRLIPVSILEWSLTSCGPWSNSPSLLPSNTQAHQVPVVSRGPSLQCSSPSPHGDAVSSERAAISSELTRHRRSPDAKRFSGTGIRVGLHQTVTACLRGEGARMTRIILTFPMP